MARRAASSLELGAWQKRPYGRRATGTAEANGRTVPVCVREPGPHIEASDYTYLFVHGWGTTRHSLRSAAHVAVKEFGHRVVTLIWTNTRPSAALVENSHDVTTALDALPDTQLAIVAHSMGAAAATGALQRTQRHVRCATFVAPGHYLSPEHYTPRNMVGSCLTEAVNVVGLVLRCGPRTALSLGAASVTNIFERGPAVVAEAYDLTHGSSHAGLEAIMKQDNPPYLRAMAGEGDGFFPYCRLWPTIAELPFNARHSYPGGHNEIVESHGSLARRVLELDALLDVPGTEPMRLAA
ncbi:MAG TPA: alpha/beta hydrolase [Candidatus Saccharimonadales bacterium]|nr:alpha/beta hydrolase [Candidatus Saccharimonadales bacterium]